MITRDQAKKQIVESWPNWVECYGLRSEKFMVNVLQIAEVREISAVMEMGDVVKSAEKD